MRTRLALLAAVAATLGLVSDKRAQEHAVLEAALLRPVLDIDPLHLRFGRQPIDSFTTKSFTITNRSDGPVLVTIETVDVPDDFSPGQPESTCTLTDEALLAAGGSCAHVVGFEPSAFFEGRQTATLLVTARNETGDVLDSREVKLSGRGF